MLGRAFFISLYVKMGMKRRFWRLLIPIFLTFGLFGGQKRQKPDKSSLWGDKFLYLSNAPGILGVKHSGVLWFAKIPATRRDFALWAFRTHCVLKGLNARLLAFSRRVEAKAPPMQSGVLWFRQGYRSVSCKPRSQTRATRKKVWKKISADENYALAA